MIICKTPLRISFFGGGTDFPKWYEQEGGEVLSTTIDKYVYVLVRKLAPVFQFNYRLRYFKNEFVKHVNQIKHPSIREVLRNFNKTKDGLEINYSSDLPAQSGLGSSSAFSVSLVHAVKELNNEKKDKYYIADKARMVEQELLKENVGSQDHYACCFGGFNSIKFAKRHKVRVDLLKINKKKLDYLKNLSTLVFTGLSRSASEIEKSKLENFKINQKYLKEISIITQQAKKIFLNKNNSHFFIAEISELLSETWKIKKKLSHKVSNYNIDNIFNHALKNGATSGKILGAGGGGFCLFISKNISDKQKLKNSLKKLTVVDYSFEKFGSKIIYKSQEI
jgi:D-glycero-alpha-D-manno-heptose-7-phosphate kinase